jgi:osmotically-inducible protein OsmY
VGEKIDDAAITASVSGGLAKDPDLSAIKINVDTKAGVVTLNGPAPTAAAKDKATEIAKKVKGVIAVNNQLIIKAS